MNLFKKEPESIETFDRLILEEEYAEAFAFAIDNKIEQEALKICIQYIQEDNEQQRKEFDDNLRNKIKNGEPVFDESKFWEGETSKIRMAEEDMKRDVDKDLGSIETMRKKVVDNLKSYGCYFIPNKEEWQENHKPKEFVCQKEVVEGALPSIQFVDYPSTSNNFFFKQDKYFLYSANEARKLNEQWAKTEAEIVRGLETINGKGFGKYFKKYSEEGQ